MKEEKCGWQDRRMSTVMLEPSEALKRGNCERISFHTPDRDEEVSAARAVKDLAALIRQADAVVQRVHSIVVVLPDDDGLGSGEAELATNHVGLRQVPAVVTHRPPCPVVVDLHAAVCSAAAEQPRVPVLRPTFRFPLKQKVRLMVAQQFFGKLPRPNLFEDDATFELNT
ncbi:hypothetical protein EYF80_058303 [Liparis tanakae]|uniref:Uncharacterized protein n=1 Tax=Liparis tanakae TaxID=230148 RepID=A0A4Z2ERS3_9TELE|nr:hypothetical protein EYF80_058303 [Liparis tanakae]